MNSVFSSRSARTFLLVPCMPTANGRLHLGHISGPYLKLDVLARHLRSRGDRVWHIFGSDPHDSFVLLRAYQTGQTPEQVGRYYHEEMVKDLLSLDIQCDLFIDPMHDDWNRLYTESITNALQRLIDRGVTEVRTEKFPYCPETGLHITGPWLLGKCPNCGAGAGSYFCENCGFCFRPESILEPRPRLPQGSMVWKDVQCLYLRLADTAPLFTKMSKMGIPDEYHTLVRRYVQFEGPAIRLTQPVKLGIPWKVPNEPAAQSVFSYFGLWAYALACGEICGKAAGLGGNAFHPQSGVTTVCSFGIDNAVPFFMFALGSALEDGSVKPFDHFLINHFFLLHGEKFSTSRNHAIWAGDIARATPAGSDAVRFFVALNNPAGEEKNFDVDDFVAFINTTLAQDWNHGVEHAWRRLSEPVGSAPGALMARLDELLQEQELALDPRQFDLARAANLADVWMKEHSSVCADSNSSYWWLKGLALLAYPIMPRFASATWTSLGHSSTPSFAVFTEHARPQKPRTTRPFLPATREQLSECLPEALRVLEPDPAEKIEEFSNS
jgi:methionyl-tRNA synthetase